MGRYAFNELLSYTDEELNKLDAAKVSDLLRRGIATAKRRAKAIYNAGYGDQIHSDFASKIYNGYESGVEKVQEMKVSKSYAQNKKNLYIVRNYLRREGSSLSGIKARNERSARQLVATVQAAEKNMSYARVSEIALLNTSEKTNRTSGLITVRFAWSEGNIEHEYVDYSFKKGEIIEIWQLIDEVREEFNQYSIKGGSTKVIAFVFEEYRQGNRDKNSIVAELKGIYEREQEQAKREREAREENLKNFKKMY